MNWRFWLRRDVDVEEEIRAHLRLAVEERVARGESPEDAEHAARREFGNTTHIAEITREQGRGWLMLVFDQVAADLRYALSGVRASPVLATVLIVSLGLGIGANAAIFSLVNVAVLKPLPVDHPEELVQVTVAGGPTSKGGARFTSGMWDAFRRRQDVFSSVFAYRSTGRADLSDGGESRPIAVGLVSGTFFETLRVRPVAGRLLTDADDIAGCPGVAVLTHAFWKAEYGGDPGIVGRALRINGRAYEIIGVAAPEFFGLGFGYYPPVWMPQCVGQLVADGGDWRGGVVVGRLRNGVSVEQARARLQTLAATLAAVAETDPPSSGSRTTQSISIGVEAFEHGFRFLRMDYGQALTALMALVGVVLLIGCANAANLLLARAASRRHEFAVRVALGASRARLIRQLLTESALLSVLAAALGLLVARWGSLALVDLLSRRGTSVVHEVPLDPNVLLFTTAVAIVTTLLFGLAPAWRAADAKASSAMRSVRGVVEGSSRWSVGRSLIVAQVALALAMVVGAGLLVGSWLTLAALNPGFRPEGVVLVGVNARGTELSPVDRGEAYRQVLTRLREVPGVSLAGAAVRTPLGNTGWDARVESTVNDTVRTLVTGMNSVSDAYFSTIGTSLIAGRDFGPADVPGSQPVAILSDTAARSLYGSPSAALGRTFSVYGSGDARAAYVIVGVVGDAKDQTLHEATGPLTYLALAQDTLPQSQVNFAILVTGGAAGRGTLERVRTEILAVHPHLSLTTRPLREQVEEMLRVPRLLGMLSGSFGLLALLLAAIGLYGIISYDVARRRSEIGMRIALGAERSRIMRLVLSDVTRMLVPGLLAGTVLSLAGGRLVAALLYGVQVNDARVLTISAAVLAIVAFGAALLPAARAARMDPVIALKES